MSFGTKDHCKTVLLLICQPLLLCNGVVFFITIKVSKNFNRSLTILVYSILVQFSRIQSTCSIIVHISNSFQFESQDYWKRMGNNHSKRRKKRPDGLNKKENLGKPATTLNENLKYKPKSNSPINSDKAKKDKTQKKTHTAEQKKDLKEVTKTYQKDKLNQLVEVKNKKSASEKNSKKNKESTKNKTRIKNDDNILQKEQYKKLVSDKIKNKNEKDNSKDNKSKSNKSKSKKPKSKKPKSKTTLKIKPEKICPPQQSPKMVKPKQLEVWQKEDKFATSITCKEDSFEKSTLSAITESISASFFKEVKFQNQKIGDHNEKKNIDVYKKITNMNKIFEPVSMSVTNKTCKSFDKSKSALFVIGEVSRPPKGKKFFDNTPCKDCLVKTMADIDCLKMNETVDPIGVSSLDSKIEINLLSNSNNELRFMEKSQRNDLNFDGQLTPIFKEEFENLYDKV